MRKPELYSIKVANWRDTLNYLVETKKITKEDKKTFCDNFMFSNDSYNYIELSSYLEIEKNPYCGIVIAECLSKVSKAILDLYGEEADDYLWNVSW